ncbi:sensor domain-containing protein [Nocardia sp. NPDC127579]|uniref:sensor domain-containing protein n=1 Tax=Nocardia sp. NPDC127579 TaxID=3345402 RepID=UPI0036393F52
MKTIWWLLAILVSVAACGTPNTGKPVAQVIPGTVQASVLTIDELGPMVGSVLTDSVSSGEPPPAFTTDPAHCAVAVGPGTRSVYATGWNAFWSKTAQDANGDHVITQVVGMFTDADQSGKAFTTLTEGLKGCASAVRTDTDEYTTGWAYILDRAEPNALGWTATQDTGDGWVCHRQARLKGKAVLQVAVCQAGDGKPAATKIVDAFAARVTG